MPDLKDFGELVIHPNFQPKLIEWLKPWRFKTYVDILVVVDTEISIDPGYDFGVARVIELIRSTNVGCMRFRVDIALRSDEDFGVNATPAATEPKYVGFRFDSVESGSDLVINKYEQIWCFGFKPSNSGSTNDGEIGEPFALETTQNELEKLDEWMTVKKGGLFGTGDHHFLGASMCHKIPRLGTMRRWTNADGVPPIGGPDRIDALRPPNNSFAAGGPNFMSVSVEDKDTTVQPIRWTAWRSVYRPFWLRRKRPHPLLCHPTLGPINVMPDHAHEGLCVVSPDLNANKKFKNELEYPDATDGGVKPEPQIIAYGSNLDSDDWNFDKGEIPGRSNNPMISAYDGHRAGVGRVATDSTWHHWMDYNINQIRAADNDDWKKISRYYINMAVWLNPPGYSTRCFYHAVAASHFQYVGFQEYHAKASTLELGRALRHHLYAIYGPCWVTERIWELPIEVELLKRKGLLEMTQRFEGSSINSESFEELVLGQMVEATLKSAKEVREAKPDAVKALPEPQKLFAKPVANAMAALTKMSDAQLKVDKEVIQRFKPKG
jgi:hypothetical protein